MSTVDDGLWSAIADPSRRRLLDLLIAGGESTATGLAALVPFTRQAVSKHLAILEGAGLVESQRQGREVRYRILPARVGEATEALAAVAGDWDRRLVRIKQLAEAAHRRAKEEER